MSDYKALFDFSKPFKKIVVPTPTSRKKVSADISSWSSRSTINSLCKPECGTDYAKKYIEEEEKQLLEHSKKLSNSNGKFDEISIGTVRTGMSDVMDIDFNKIYRTYNFAHRPQQTLPVNSMKDKIISMIETNSVLVIEGPTGCGKTTQVPQFVLDSCFQKKVHCNIIVTQPRKIAAISIAKRVSEEREWPLGTLVGFKVGMLNKTSQDTRLTYCTTGVLLRQLITQKSMLNYTHVILDEVHERDQEMDFLLLVVRKLLRSNSRSVKVILMSATINVDKFANYFSSPINNKMVPAPIIDIAKNHAYEIEKYYLCQLGALGVLPHIAWDNPRVSTEMMEFCSKLVNVFDEIDNEHRHVVLIFLPGIWEIEEMHQSLTNFIQRNDPKWDIVVLHSTITNEEQQTIFELPPEGYRRIILSTNIAESSITVPDVKYVIDFCLAKVLVTNPETNFQCLELTWASKANCEQRAGRTGRTTAGRVYRLVPKRFYEGNFVEESPPEIQRAPLEHTVLNAKLLDMGSPKTLLALSLDPPDLFNIERTILILKEVGALLNQNVDSDRFDGELTGLGRMMASLPININVAKLIALGHAFGVLRSTIIIGASISTKSVFSNPFKKKIQAYSMKLNWSQGSSSDCIAFLNVYNMWMSEKANRNIRNKKSEKAWAERHFIQLRALYEINTLIQELTYRLKNIGIIVPTGVHHLDDQKNFGFILKTVIAGAFYPNYFQNINASDLSDNEDLKVIAGLDPNRTVYVKGWPQNQPGPLYTKNFQQIFQGCCGIKQKTNMRISFDFSSRAYITFGSEAMKLRHVDDAADFNVSGKISNAVYRALKMRDNGDIIMPIMRADEANKIAKELNLQRHVGFTDYFRPNKTSQFSYDDEEQVRSIEQSNKNESNKHNIYIYKRSILPGLIVFYMPIVITKVNDPCQFWARSKDDEADLIYQKIESEIKKESKLIPLNHKPFIGELVIACLKEQDKALYYRAMVRNIAIENNQEKIGVYLVDVGQVYEFFTNDLRQFREPNDVMTYPAQAFECTLACLKPKETHKHDNRFTTAVITSFNKLIRQAKCYAEIYSVVNSVIHMKLNCVLSNQRRIKINDWLIAQGHCELQEEDFQSKKNHDIRLESAELSKEQVHFYEDSQYDHSDIQFKVPEINESQCNTSIYLKGPYSPLEMNLYSLVISGCGRRVKINQMSVNSVLLNTNPGVNYSRLVIAGIVHQNVSGTLLNLDVTTLMPNIPGLISLLALIFAPKIELRRNKYGNRYSSGLCGLGYDILSRNSLFLEHDMEIGFDVDIDNNDLLMINKLRHWLSVILELSNGKETDIEETIKCQEKVRESFMAIFEKERNQQKVEFTTKMGQWKAYDETLILQPAKVYMIKNNIYPLHNALELVPTEPLFEEMTEHYDEIRKLLVEDPQKHIEDIVCKFCNEKVFGIYELRIHIMKPDHDENVRKYGISLYY